MVKKEEFVFDSRDGQSKIHAVRWIPEGKVIGILQIVHGMAEYIERYEEMAHFFFFLCVCIEKRAHSPAVTGK